MNLTLEEILAWLPFEHRMVTSGSTHVKNPHTHILALESYSVGGMMYNTPIEGKLICRHNLRCIVPTERETLTCPLCIRRLGTLYRVAHGLPLEQLPPEILPPAPVPLLADEQAAELLKDTDYIPIAHGYGPRRTQAAAKVHLIDKNLLPEDGKCRGTKTLCNYWLRGLVDLPPMDTIITCPACLGRLARERIYKCRLTLPTTASS